MSYYSQRRKEQRKKEFMELRKQKRLEENQKLVIEEKSSLNKPEPKPICDVIPENQLFCEVLDKEILVIMTADQLNILGQTFRPMFTGKVVEVTNGYITLDPVIIKMTNAPFYRFPTPLSFPIESISSFTPFDSDTRIPIP
jgi:hypothetical protein